MTWKPTYATATELKNFVRIDDSTEDTLIDLVLEAASRAVDRHTRRQFGQVASGTERKYTAWWNRRRQRWIVDIDDLMTTSGITLTITSVGTIDAYDLEPINAEADGMPWTQLSVKSTSSAIPTGDDHEVVIDALWGWTAVPDTIKEAVLLSASRFFSRRSSPYGVAGSPDLGSELRLLAKIDPDVEVMLGDYVRDEYPQ